MKLSLLVVAMILACGNATSNEPNTNAATQSQTQTQTQTTGATVQRGTTKSGDYNQITDGKGMPGVGSDRSVATPEGVSPRPPLATPRSPAPPNTGDPPPIDRR